MKYSFVFVATALVTARAATAAAIDNRGTAVYSRDTPSAPYPLERRGPVDGPQRLSTRDFDDEPYERRGWLHKKMEAFKADYDTRMANHFTKKATRHANSAALSSHPSTSSLSSTSSGSSLGSTSPGATTPSDMASSPPTGGSDPTSSDPNAGASPDGMSRRGLNDQITSRDSFSEGLEVRNTLRSDAVPASNYPKVNMRDVIDARDSVESDLQQRSPGLMQWLGAAKDTLLGTPAPQAAPATGASAPMGVSAGMRKREVMEDQYFEARDFEDDLYERAVIDDELYARDYAINDLN